MEVKEIYSKLAAHMIKGMMVHEQLANYYDFLGLKGYKRCHEYHFLKETIGYRSLNRYFINHHNTLIPEERVEDPNVIPESWYNHVRSDVDIATKQNGVKNGLTKWVEWERDTKDLYEQMYKELMEIGEVASAMKIKEFVEDVDCELKKAERYWLNKEATNYDMTMIIEEQSHKHKKYQKLCEKELKVSIC